MNYTLTKAPVQICSDKATRILYATDASIYYCEPLGVYFPKEQEDLVKLIHFARENSLAVLPRGAGTSLAGQALTSGIVVDLSSFKKLDIQKSTAYLEPGVIIDEIDKAGDFRYGPAPASSNRATIGGVLANNGTGARSILYGMACDQLLSAKVLLSNGTIRTFKRNDLDETDAFTKKILEVTNKVKDSSCWPKVWRNASGLNIPGIYKYNSLLPLFCGSEGSLGIILEAEVSLATKPQKSQLALFYYDSLVAAMRAVPKLLQTKPSAIELMDHHLIRLAQKSATFEMKVIKEIPQAMLIVEYEERDISQKAIGAKQIVDDPLEQEEVWKTRKEGLGILMSSRSKRRPVAFIEDCSVPVEHLPTFVIQLEQILKKHDTFGAFYAHASAGCLHIRPLLDLKDQDDVSRMHQIAKECSYLVAQLDGTLSGEHGDGRTKGPYLETIFGKELVSAFAQVQNIFDPYGVFKATGEVALRTSRALQPMKTSLQWPTSFADETERCNGEGGCRKTTGVMCPSFQISKDPKLSTRGRANLLRAFIAGENVEKQLSASLEKCLACKACSFECPSQVDMALMKTEYLHSQGNSLQDHFFSHFATLSKWASLLGMPAKSIVKKLFSIHPKCVLPAPAKKRFTQLFSSKIKLEESDAIFFIDTHIEFYEPEIGLAMMQIAEALQLQIAPVYLGCCARPAFSRGVLSMAKKQLQQINIQGSNPILIAEPSCLSMLKEDAPKLLPRMASLSKRLQAPEKFLLTYEQKLKQLACKSKTKILYHGHCHQKAMRLSAYSCKLLSLFADVKLIDAGCCGMVGSFGYSNKTYDLAMAIANDRFFPAIKNQEGPIAMPGRSCREMALSENITTHHPLVLLAQLLDQGKRPC